MCTFHLLNIAYRNRDFTAIFFLQLCECDGMWALSITILSTQTHTGRYCILRLISLSVYALEIPVMHRGLSNVNDGFCKLCLSACVHKATFKWISSPESAYKWNQFGKNAFGCTQILRLFFCFCSNFCSIHLKIIQFSLSIYKRFAFLLNERRKNVITWKIASSLNARFMKWFV